MRPGRKAYVKLEYNGTVVFLEVSEELLSFSYTDNADKADEITFVVQDKNGNWAGSWWPQPRTVQE